MVGQAVQPVNKRPNINDRLDSLSYNYFMLALVREGDKVRLKNDHPLPSRTTKGEALVSVTLAGICRTDIELANGYMDFQGVLGHEFVGVVTESDAPALRGQRVVGEINCWCGECEYCRAGLGRHCPRRTVLGISGRDGVFAEQVAIPEANLHRVPEGVSDEEAVFTEPLAAACRVVEQTKLRDGERAVVLGDGKLGLLVCAALRRCGADVVLLGRHPENLAIAKSWGVRGCLESERLGLAARVVVDCSGSESGFTRALELVEPCGVVVLKTTLARGYNVNLAPIVIKEVIVQGSRCGPFDAAVEFLSERSIDVRRLITATYRLEDSLTAMELAAKKGSLKVLLRPCGD